MISGRLSELLVETRAPANAVERVRYGEDERVVDETCAALIRSLGPITLWTTPEDIQQVPGTDVAVWPARIGTPPAQAVLALQPELEKYWSGDRMSVGFDALGEALPTGQLLDGETCTVAAVYSCEPGAHLRVFWEQTQQYNGNNGYYFGSITNAASGKTIAPLAGAGGVGTSNYLVDGDMELSGTGPHCIVATHDRSLGAVRGSTMVSDGVPTTVITLETTQDVAGTFQPGTGSYMGSRNNGASRGMNGSFGEFVVYNRQLDADALVTLSRALMFRARLL